MRKSLELQETRSRKLEIAMDIQAKPLNDETRVMLDNILAEIEILNKDIKRYQSIERNVADDMTEPNTPPSPTVTPQLPNKSEHRKFRTGPLKAFKHEQDAYDAGMWILAALYKNPTAERYCVQNGLNVRAAAVEGVNSSGGYLVPDVLEQTIIDLRDSYGLFRQYAGVYAMSSDHVNMPRRAGGLTAYAVGETDDITDSSASWNNVELVARKWAVLAKYSSEIAEDAVISIAENLAQEAAYALAKAEDGAGFNGDGTGTYHGITGAITKFDLGTATYVGSVAAAAGHNLISEIDITDIVNVTAQLPQYAYAMGPAWYCSNAVWATCFQKLAANAGGNTKADMQGAFGREFLGYPVRITPSMRTALTDLATYTVLMFGVLSAAVTFGSRRGITMATSTDRYFESDQLAIRVTERFDINVHDIGNATTAGPLVALHLTA